MTTKKHIELTIPVPWSPRPAKLAVFSIWALMVIGAFGAALVLTVHYFA